METRKSDYPILDLILTRRSMRAMSGEPLTQKELNQLFEAARWAPSAYNNQPWRFAYAHRGTSDWDVFFNLLVEFNQQWAKNAGALVVIASRTTFQKTGKLSRTHAFDTGSAWENLALQGHAMGLVVHAMEGFDYKKARVQLEVPQEYEIHCMVAIGKPAPKETLSDELQEKEVSTNRKPVSDFTFEGKFVD